MQKGIAHKYKTHKGIPAPITCKKNIIPHVINAQLYGFPRNDPIMDLIFFGAVPAEYAGEEGGSLTTVAAADSGCVDIYIL